MKKHKILLLVLLIGIVLVFFIGFIFLIISKLSFYYYLETRPSGQENTTWSSEDGEILIYIDEVGRGKISFEQKGSTIECYFVSAYGYFAEVYSWEVVETNILTPEALCERWAYLKVREDTFTITVEKTTFLKTGDKIKFHKIDET